MSIEDTIWEMKPHTEAKLIILRKYLDAWLPILSSFNKRILYIDGFAGPGEYVGGKEGSPIVAIKAFLDQKKPIINEVKMIFVEKDPDRCDFLKKKINQIERPKNLIVGVICGKFDEIIGTKLDEFKKQGYFLIPSFVFIDPFGFTGIPFTIVENILRSPRCEVLINLMYEEMNRFISLPALEDSITNTFGTNEWKKVNEESDSLKREKILIEVYKSQLLNKAKVKYVRTFKMKNKSSSTDYYLFFATNSIDGLKKMKEAMWKVDEYGNFEFSDASYMPGQAILFEKEPNYKELKRLIINEFGGKTVVVEEVESFVVVKTPYRETHYKRQVLKEMEESMPPEIIVTSENKRRKGTFPEGIKIQFM